MTTVFSVPKDQSVRIPCMNQVVHCLPSVMERVSRLALLKKACVHARNSKTARKTDKDFMMNAAVMNGEEKSRN